MSETPETQKPPCYIHKDCNKQNRDEIHQLVCQDLKYQTTEHDDGNHYCVLHLPSNEKDISEFNQIFQNRIKEVDKKISEIETKYSTPEFKSPYFDPYKKEEIKLQKYYFRYVWFPANVELKGREFKSDVDFLYATFLSDASFDESIFLGELLLADVNFLSKVSFRKAKFSLLT